MIALTPEQAAVSYLCPLARTFIIHAGSSLSGGGCKGPACAAWRWQPILADDPRFIAALKLAKKTQELDHQKAVAYVMANREALGVPTKPEKGFCGLGGAL